MSTPVRTRIAPSPTGAFHVGTARTALFNYLYAKRQGGVFVLRIEDTDQARSTPESLATIYAGMRWLGLAWDEGPEVGGDFGPYCQSERLPLYQEHLDRLLAAGKAYECFCTPDELRARREQRQQAKQDPKYDGRCRDLSKEERERLRAEGRPVALRFRCPTVGDTGWVDLVRGPVSFENALLEDFVIRKADGFPTYNCAVVLDDALMRITHVLRGEDGLSNTPRQLLLYEAFGFDPPAFGHLPLLLGPDRSKLSKRHGATSVSEFEAQGILPECLFNYLALLGWSAGEGEAQEVLTPEELRSRFDLDGITKAGAIFDHEKLVWMNGLYLRSLPEEQFLERALAVLSEAGLVSSPPTDRQTDMVRDVVPLVRERLRVLTELPDAVRYFFTDEFEYDAKAEKKWLRKAETADTLRGLIQSLQPLKTFSDDSLEETVRAFAEAHELSAGKVIHPTRVAVTGRTVGPGLFELMAVLGKDVCLRRLRHALDYMRKQGYCS